MDDKEAKKIADRVISALASKSKLEPHERSVTARECDIKHGQVMTVLRAQTGKMEAVHTDVKGMKTELSETTKKINGHESWHNGIKEEKSDAQIKKSQKTASLGSIAKWAAVALAALALIGKLTLDSMKMHNLAEEVAMKVNNNGVNHGTKTPE